MRWSFWKTAKHRQNLLHLCRRTLCAGGTKLQLDTKLDQPLEGALVESWCCESVGYTASQAPCQHCRVVWARVRTGRFGRSTGQKGLQPPQPRRGAGWVVMLRSGARRSGLRPRSHSQGMFARCHRRSQLINDGLRCAGRFMGTSPVLTLHAGQERVPGNVCTQRTGDERATAGQLGRGLRTDGSVS